MPKSDDVFAKALQYVKLPSAALVVPFLGSLRARRIASLSRSIEADATHLLNLRAMLPNVRRALANIATYMIFDDHEVTDDWNMTHDLAVKLYGTAVGPQVVKNALAAYVLCQHWGNVPERFVSSADGSTPMPADNFRAFIDAGARTDNWQQVGVNYAGFSSNLQTLLGVPTPLGIDLNKGIKHEPNSLTYNYVVEGTVHQVVVTDSRSWRAFPRGGNEAPDLLTPDQFAAQIVNPSDAKALNGRLLIVVLSTNMPPFPGIRAATENAKLVNAVEHNPDIHEAWDLPSIAFDRLVKALSDRVGFTAGQSGKVVVLSGDVHFGFASRLHYQAVKRFEENQSPAQHANLVIAQLVASSFKKQTQDTLDIQREGYNYHKTGLRGLVEPHVTEYYVGWNVQPTGQRVATWESQAVTLREAGSVRLPYPWPSNIDDGIAGISFPIYPPLSYGKLTGTLGAPDYSYQFDYLHISNAGVPSNLASLPVVPPAVKPSALTKEEKQNRAQLYQIASTNYRTINSDPNVVRHIIGVNNMGDLTFPPPSTNGPFIAQHRLRFWTPDGHQLFADYSVNMETIDNGHPADTNYPQVAP
jgi:hypothetical protein